MKGLVLNIQRFSTDDGPGIRTTVFLKGCTNACAWCHNPESMRPEVELQIYPERCIGCGRCLAVCPVGAHEEVDGEKVHDRERCRHCGRCVEDCFAGALVMAGKAMSVDEVMAEIGEDEAYYRHSSGGVTFSGGEPVLQREFLLALLRRCKESGIHTAIDTAGNYPWAFLEDILPHIDLVMYDIKILDPELHERYVGNRGDRVRDNLKKLADAGCPFVVRTPVVGGVNGNEEEVGNIARLIGGMEGLLYYQLVPYHKLGNPKLQSLGLPEEQGFHTPADERMRELAEVARKFVREVRP